MVAAVEPAQMGARTHLSPKQGQSGPQPEKIVDPRLNSGEAP